MAETGRKLKNYIEYRRRINNYAAALGITIKYDFSDNETAYVGKFDLVKLDPDLLQSDEIACTLHEIGHFFDTKMFEPVNNTKLELAYNAVYTKKTPSHNQKAMVKASERRAWKLARKIAKRLCIPLGRWYYLCETDCLKSYNK